MAFKSKEEVEASRLKKDFEDVDYAFKDHAEMDARISTRISGVITEVPDVRHLGSDKLVLLKVKEPGRNNSLSAVYRASAYEKVGSFGFEGLEDRVSALKVGDQISLAGKWSKKDWTDRAGQSRSSWEFSTKLFEKGDHSIAQMKQMSLDRVNAFATSIGTGDKGVASSEKSTIQHGGKPKASPTLFYASGNLLDDNAQVLVNTVNSQLSDRGNPVMGAGVALAFKERYPSILKPYADAIKSGELKPGRALLFDLPDGRKWVALATKDHFKDKSQLEWVDSGLKELGDVLRREGVKSVALPPPGCGNGGLDWKEVEPLVHKHLAGINVSMYAKPSGAMEPALNPQFEGMNTVNAPDNDRKSRALAALGGDPVEKTKVSNPQKKGFSEDELVAMVPRLLAHGSGYRPYAGIGSRETPEDVADDMTAIARVLEARGFTLRSGFAGGADTAFELGTKKDSQREIFAPWKGFGTNRDSPYEKKRWDMVARFERMTGEEFIPAKGVLLQGEMAAKSFKLASAHHPTWDKLQPSHQKLHARNMGQVLGPKLDHKAHFEMAYTIDGKATGGTGQAIRVAEAEGIPVLNLHSQRVREAVLKELGLDLVRNYEKDLAVAEAERARADYRDRYEGASMSAAMRDRTAESVRSFNQGDSLDRTSAPKEMTQGTIHALKQIDTDSEKFLSKSEARKAGEVIDLTTPTMRTRNEEDVVSFFKVSEPFGALSNMYNRAPIEVNGVTWKSTEALYQALRFPHNPELQENIRLESNAFTAKQLAHKHIEETRPDWDEIKEHAMAWVVTLKKDQSADFRADLDASNGKDIVERSSRDTFWGAKLENGKFTGRDVLGNILTQVRDGARMDEPPPNSLLLGEPIAANRNMSGQEASSEKEFRLPDPDLKASMYFKYGNNRREGFTAESTFEAILKGERTSTTRYKEWGGMERWERLKPGAVVRFYEDKEMRGKSVDVVVTSLQKISLREMDNRQLDEWSKVEGWSVAHARESGKKYSEGVQIRYALPDTPEAQEALGFGKAGEKTSEREIERPANTQAQTRPTGAQLAAMSDKQKWMNAL